MVIALRPSSRVETRVSWPPSGVGVVLLPCGGDIAGQLQGVDAGVMGLQVSPEQLAEKVGDALQGGEVDRRLAFT
jgi:hypothetical protein